jgi:endonuclease III
MASIQEKFDATVAELQATVEEYNNAVKQMEVTKEKAIALQGAAQTLRELLESEAEAAVEPEVVTPEAG